MSKLHARFRVALLALWVASPAFAQVIGPGGNVIPPGAGGSSANPWAAFGVPNSKCDGVTDDSAAFNAALASGNNIVLPPRVTCVVANLNFTTTQQWMDCNNSILQSAPSAAGQPIITIKAAFWQLSRCIPNDPNSYSAVSTTLVGAVGGGNAIAVASSVGIGNGEPVMIQTAEGAFFQTKTLLNGGVVGNVLNLADNVPALATTAAITSGGSGCAVGDALVAQGGGGPPATFRVATVSGSAVATVTLAAPGFYTTEPGTAGVGVSLVAPAHQSCQGVVATLTMVIGYGNGAILKASWGVVKVLDSSYFTMSDIKCSIVVACVGYYNDVTTGISATQGNSERISCGACQMFTMAVDAGVNNSNFSDVFGFGTPHDGNQDGSVGLYRNFQNPAWSSIPSGGNHFRNVSFLNSQIGTLIRGSNAGLTNDFYDDGWTNDTIQYYGVVCDGCNNLTASGLVWNSFTGAGGNYGIGWYQGKYTNPGAGSPTPAINNIIPGNVATANAADFYFSDWFGDLSGTGAALSIGNGINIHQTVAGISAAILSARPIITGTTGAIVGGGATTIYLSNGIGSTTTSDAFASIPIANFETVTSFYCHADNTPTVDGKYTCNLRDLPTPTGSTSTIATCTIPAGSFQCSFVGMAPNINPGDQLNVQIVPSAGAGTAPATVFSASAAGF